MGINGEIQSFHDLNKSYPEIFLLSRLVDGITNTGHSCEHSLANIIVFVLLIRIFHGHEVFLSAQFALVQEFPQKDHHLGVVELIH